MPHTPHTLPRFVIYLFFIIGLVSAVLFRALVVLQRLSPDWVRPVWYTAVIGYVMFFLYRYRISQKRRHAIEKYNLIEKIRADKCLGDDEREAAVYLMESIEKSLENLNYYIIFALSIVAIATDLILAHIGL